MSARLQFLVGYLGSAALVAFVFACLDAPRVATFACDTPNGECARRCPLIDTWSSTPSSTDDLARSRSREPMRVSAR